MADFIYGSMYRTKTEFFNVSVTVPWWHWNKGMSTEGKEQALHMWRHRESDRNDVKMSALRMYISAVHQIKPNYIITYYESAIVLYSFKAGRKSC